jgi:5-methylcytosine-specific restriction protein A
MPYSPRRQCPGRGLYTNKCSNLIKGKERYCLVCSEYIKKEVRKYDKGRDQTQERKFLHSPQWRKIRKRKLAQDPLCEKCSELGKDTMAVLVHHVNKNQMDNSPENHSSVCQSCHLILHKNDLFGKNNRKGKQ